MKDVYGEEELPTKTILLLLREAAMVRTREQFKLTAKMCADQLSTAIDLFSKHPTYQNLIDVNGLFAVAHRLLRIENAAPPDGGGGGVMRQGKFEMLEVAAAA